MHISYNADADRLEITLVRGVVPSDSVLAPRGGVRLNFDATRLLSVEIATAGERYPATNLAELEPSDLLTLAAAARRARLSPATLRNQIRNGKLVAIKRGRDWVVSRAALKTYMEDRAPRGWHPSGPRRRAARRRSSAVSVRS